MALSRIRKGSDPDSVPKQTQRLSIVIPSNEDSVQIIEVYNDKRQIEAMYRVISNHCPNCESTSIDCDDYTFEDSLVVAVHTCNECQCRFRAYYDCTMKEVLP